MFQEHTGTFNWTKQWYPLASEIDLDPSKPHSLMLLGMSCTQHCYACEWGYFSGIVAYGTPCSTCDIDQCFEICMAYREATGALEGWGAAVALL